MSDISDLRAALDDIQNALDALETEIEQLENDYYNDDQDGDSEFDEFDEVLNYLNLIDDETLAQLLEAREAARAKKRFDALLLRRFGTTDESEIRYYWKLG